MFSMRFILIVALLTTAVALESIDWTLDDSQETISNSTTAKTGSKQHDEGKPSKECQECIDEVRGFIEFIHMPEIERVVVKTLDFTCALFHVEDQDKERCKREASEETKKLINVIYYMVNPKMVCRNIGVCEQPPREEVLLESGEQQESKSETKHDTSEKCRFCIDMLDASIGFLHNERFKQTLSAIPDLICELITPDEVGPCKKVVGNLIDINVERVSKIFKPRLTCMMMLQCSYEGAPSDDLVDSNEIEDGDHGKSGHWSQVESKLVDTLIKFKAQDPEICSECWIFLSVAKELIKSKFTIGFAKDLMHVSLCNRMHSLEYRDHCIRLVGEKLKTFAGIVSDQLKPGHICPCSSDRRPVVKKGEVGPRGSFVCDECTVIVGTINDYLNKHPVDKDVQSIVDNICNQIPIDFVKEECTTLVISFGQIIIDNFEGGKTPIETCSQVHFC